MMLRTLPAHRAVLPAALAVALATSARRTSPTVHLADLRERGRQRVAFVLEQLERHNLVVFDDALHARRAVRVLRGGW